MKVLSLFDGISCARVALERAKLSVEVYFASEVDKYAIQIAQKNYPDTKQIGDIKDLFYGVPLEEIQKWDIDLLIGGSPCQDLSIAKRNRKGLDGERSGLFWEYVRILKGVKPKYFILENVASMPEEAKNLITKTLGVEPVLFNASLVSAQMRKRLFWTNINFTLPEDKNIKLKDILIDGIAEKEKSLVITATYSRACPQDYFGKSNRQLIKVGEFNSGGQGDRVYSIDGKSVTLSALGGGRGAKTGLYETTKGIYRKLHPIECERLQGLPDNYTEGVSNSQRYKMLGNAFNVDVVAHILSFIPKNNFSPQIQRITIKIKDTIKQKIFKALDEHNYLTDLTDWNTAEEYKKPCDKDIKDCLKHKYHCVKCNTPVSYSPANYASRLQDIPNSCEYCDLLKL